MWKTCLTLVACILISSAAQAQDRKLAQRQFDQWFKAMERAFAAYVSLEDELLDGIRVANDTDPDRLIIERHWRDLEPSNEQIAALPETFETRIKGADLCREALIDFKWLWSTSREIRTANDDRFLDYASDYIAAAWACEKALKRKTADTRLRSTLLTLLESREERRKSASMPKAIGPIKLDTSINSGEFDIIIFNVFKQGLRDQIQGRRITAYANPSKTENHIAIGMIIANIYRDICKLQSVDVIIRRSDAPWYLAKPGSRAVPGNVTLLASVAWAGPPFDYSSSAAGIFGFPTREEIDAAQFYFERQRWYEFRDYGHPGRAIERAYADLKSKYGARVPAWINSPESPEGGISIRLKNINIGANNSLWQTNPADVNPEFIKIVRSTCAGYSVQE